MTNEEFFTFLTNRFNEISTLSRNKAIEYNDGDAFENFDKASKILNIEKENVALHYMTKHLVSLVDIVENKRNRHLIKEKTNDIIVYAMLIDAMLSEKNNSNN